MTIDFCGLRERGGVRVLKMHFTCQSCQIMFYNINIHVCTDNYEVNNNFFSLMVLKFIRHCNHDKRILN